MAMGKLNFYIWLSSSSKKKTFLTRRSRINGVEFQNRWGNSKSKKFQVHIKDTWGFWKSADKKENKKDVRRWEIRKLLPQFLRGGEEDTRKQWHSMGYSSLSVRIDLDTDDLWILTWKQCSQGQPHSGLSEQSYAQLTSEHTGIWN